jgi:pSer/pThr/pTyr-binding forkhead associated (FHA) protein
MESSPEKFLEACGGREPPQIDIAHWDNREATRWTLPLPFALIGREERADLRLDDVNVSHRHAYLQMVSGHLWCVDLGSRTGLQGENGRLAASALLPNQTIRIGPYALRTVEDEMPASPPLNPLTCAADDLARLPRIALDIHSGTAREKTWLVDRPLTLVGRAAFCKIRLHSSMVSRVHCALLNTPEGLWAIDLLGREGTYINDRPVRWARLEEGDVLQVDQFHMRTRMLAPAQSNLPVRRSTASETALVTQSSAPIPTAPTAMVPTAANALLAPLFAQFSEMQQQMFDQFQQSLLLMAQMLGGLQREQMQRIEQEMEQLRTITRELQEVQAASQKATVATRSSEVQIEPQAQPREETPKRKSKAEQVPVVPASADVHLRLAQRLAALQQERQSRWQKILGMLSGK